MEILHIVLVSAFSIILMFIVTKIMGNREISQLSMFDYINGITIGSIAAEMATSLEDDFIKPTVAIIVYAIIIFLISIFTNKSIIAQRFINGRSLILYDNNVFYKKNLKKAKVNLAEFMTECRNKGFFNMADIQSVFIEANGKFTVLPKSIKRNITPEDLNLQVDDDRKVFNVIIDRQILKDNLKATGNNERWLLEEMKKQNAYLKEVFLATVDSKNNLSVYKYNEKYYKHDPFI